MSRSATPRAPRHRARGRSGAAGGTAPAAVRPASRAAFPGNRVARPHAVPARGHPSRARRGPQIEVAQAVPDLLLGPAGDPEGRQVPRPVRVVEIGRHRQLEHPPLIGGRIPLAEAAFPEAGVAPPAARAPGCAPAKRRVELRARLAPGRRGRDQRQRVDPIGVSTAYSTASRPPQEYPARSRRSMPHSTGAAPRGPPPAPASRPGPRGRPASGRRRAGRSRSASGRGPARRSPGSR